MTRRSAGVAVALGGLLVSLLCGCRSPEPGEHLSEPIIHIGSNTKDPGLMETLVADTLKRFVRRRPGRRPLILPVVREV